MTVLRVSVVMAMSAVMVACGSDPGPVDSGPGPVDAPMADAPTTPVDAQMADTGTTPSRMCPFAGGACDVLAQDCPGTDGCYFGSTGPGVPASTICVPPGTGADGDPCANTNDCQPGLTCGADSQCHNYCCMQMASDCEVGQICIGRTGAGDIGVCNVIDNCALAPQGGCEAGENCEIIAPDGSTSCFEAGTVAEGATCENLNSCQIGLGCYGIGGAGPQCYKFCRIGMDSDCSGGRTCTMLGSGFPTGIGLCIAPAAGG